MLSEFVTANRQLLIARCLEKGAKRFARPETATAIESDVPLFLEQLAATLKAEQTTTSRKSDTEPSPTPTAIGRAAALHGAELLRSGFTIDQVVHHYGDVCQSVTALAVEREVAISTDEFRTLNRCLDNAIADAVVAFGVASQETADARAHTLHDRLVNYIADEKRLNAIACQSFTAIKTGNIGPGGATGDLLLHTLKALDALTDRLQSAP
jgi:hypothetical protein